jgi:hypothetical protein
MIQEDPDERSLLSKTFLQIMIVIGFWGTPVLFLVLLLVL